MVFAWDAINLEHIGEHQVSAEEAEEIVRDAARPFPRMVEDGKYVVWGRTTAGRHLQVIYVLKKPSEVAYESLSVADWMRVESSTPWI